MDEKLRKLEREAASGDPEAVKRLEHEQARIEPAWKTHWRKIDKACQMVQALVEERTYPHKIHGSHGFYMEVTLNNREYILDPTPETTYQSGPIKEYPPGIVIVRGPVGSGSGGNSRSTMAEINVFDEHPELIVGMKHLGQFLSRLNADM